MFSFIGLEQSKAIIEKYDKKPCIPCLLKCCRHLHSLFGNIIIDQGVDENCSLDTFEMTTNTNEPTKKLVNRELPMNVNLISKL